MNKKINNLHEFFLIRDDASVCVCVSQSVSVIELLMNGACLGGLPAVAARAGDLPSVIYEFEIISIITKGSNTLSQLPGQVRQLLLGETEIGGGGLE